MNSTALIQQLAAALCLTAMAFTWSCSRPPAAPAAPAPAVSANRDGVLLYDFEQRSHRYRLHIEDSLTPASATGRLDSDVFKDGAASYRIEFDFPRNSAGISLNQVALRPDQRTKEFWGFEAWCHLDAPQPLSLEFLIEEDSGELWTVGANLRTDAMATEWHRIILPLEWAGLLSWTRDNGRLDSDQIKTIRPFVKKWDGGRSAKGTLWLDSISIITGARPVSAATQGNFVLLDLARAFDSDTFARRENPTDGDFHTGDWEPRTYPAEHMPQVSPAMLQGIPFNMPPLDDGLDNTIRCNGQRLVGFPPGTYSALYVLCTGKFGDHADDVILHYADGNPERRAFLIGDTGRRPRFGEVTAIPFPFIYHEKNIDNRQPEFFIQSVRVAPDRALQSITLPYNDFIKIFAVTFSTAAAPPAVGAMHSEPLAIVDPRYRMPDTLNLDFSAPVRPAGALGGYMHRRPHTYRLEIPGFNGFMAFSANAEDIPNHRLFFDKLVTREPAFSIGGLCTEGAMSTALQTTLLDSTCIENSAQITTRLGQKFNYKVTASRAWPAILYETTAPEFYWYDPNEGGQAWVTMAQADGLLSRPMKDGDALPMPAEPWILIWHTAGDDARRAFDAPVLLVLEKRPLSLDVRKNRKDGGMELRMRHDGSAVRLAAMPLLGIQRLQITETGRWADASLPDDVIQKVRAWAQRLQFFPVTLHQSFSMDEAKNELTITERFDWITLESDWPIEPQRFTPYPPVAILARRHDYPVALNPEAFDSGMAVYAGPLWGIEDDESRYTIPLTPYTECVLAPARLEQHPLSDTLHKEFERALKDAVPARFTPKDLHSDTAHDLSIQRIIAPSRLLTGHDDNRLLAYSRAAVENALSDANLKLEMEPLTGQAYLMDDRFWAKDRSYDKEWANGFMLQGLWHHAWYHNDVETVRAHWNKILGLYRYYQIIFDWTNATTWTIATGGGANSDGMRIAWEGMVCMARLASMAGDEATYADARIRASRQMMSLYASWFAPQWAVEQDYVTRANRHIPAESAETRFSPDVLWVETYICNTCRPQDFFQVTHAFYVYNLSQFLFLHDYRLDTSKIEPWVMQAVPEHHPQWADGNAVNSFTHQYYGNNATMAHLIIRSMLLHEAPEQVLEYYKSSTDNTQSIKQWYSPLGLAPYVFAAMQSGAGPGVIVPVAGWHIEENVYRFEDRHHRLTMTSTQPAEGQVRFWCWQRPPSRISINGQDVAWDWDAALNYATVTIKAEAPKARMEIDVRFDGAP